MPGKFVHKGGTTIAGHADKWSDENRRPNSHDAGNGKKAKMSQGTGEQGKRNTIPSQGTDTSKMNPEDKMKYFNSLGLMPKVEAPKPSIKTWPDTLRKVFKGEEQYLKDISKSIKSIPPAQYQNKIQNAFNATHEVMQETDDVYDIYAAIMNALQN